MTFMLPGIKPIAVRSVPLLASLLTLALIVSTYGPNVAAQRAAEGDKEERKTTQTAAMSEKVYKKLTEAQEVIEAEKFNEGLAILRSILSEKNLSPYESAQVHNYFAYTYFTLERYDDAIRSYEEVLRQPELPIALVMNSTYTLAQLYFIKEDYNRAIKYINDWFGMTDQPTENAYMLLGQAYYQLEKYKEALVPLKTAYSIVQNRGDKPRENLLLLLQAVYLNMNDYNNVLVVLKELVQLYPKPQYWQTMGGTYSELKQLKKQMSIYEMLYEAGNLESGSQQLNLANLYLLHEVPYKAAKVLDKGIQSGEIKKDVRNLRLLSQAWLTSQESRKSIGPLREAADKSDDGELDIQLAYAHINLGNHQEAVEALERGLRKGNIKRPDQAYIMLGMSQFELKNYNSAIRAFLEAAKDGRSAKSANQWRSYVESERDREKALEEELKQRRS